MLQGRGHRRDPARGFFLIPALIPFAVIAVCVTTVLIGRPLTGLVLNRVAGGPADWRSVPRLRRIHTVPTLTCAAVNGALQVSYYRGNQPWPWARSTLRRARHG
ncbi:DUF3159 domain-containing protein [Amycolatopsis sp. NBC_00438]|uniref:DUF3159 domain-containing protein n=1 Tax=Amycolatopsis sp. NBC_00438 TaxID=2903558 RepID=UPI002E1A842F